MKLMDILYSKQKEEIKIMERKEDDSMYMLEEILENWNIAKPYKVSEVDVTKYENGKPNAWIVNEIYVLKRFVNPDYMKQGIEITKALAGEWVPVAVPVKTKAQTDYCMIDNEYFCLYPRLAGKGLRDHFEGNYLNRATYLGQIIGNLHRAFVKCGSIITFHENNLFEDVANWAIPIAKEFAEKRGVLICDELINNYKSGFEGIYKELTRQIIHRDSHGENLLFENGRFTGYVDFDLSQWNVRIFDPCYMSTGILSGCFEDADKRQHWISIFKNIIEGYDAVCILSHEEKRALIYVLYSIQFIFIAYFVENGYPQLAETNIRMLNWIYENRNRLEVL
ncbi:MAG: phosphotransferase [Firmicutes bacterium]|nr:phosphotransferase [Bacillota bacterium]